jgi:hypothetical protein
MLVDPELAARARELLREPDEVDGKGDHMSALGTHEITSGMSLGLEPPLSPPVVRSPMASAMRTGDGLAGLPTPPPAIRPPESAPPAPAPAPQVVEVPQPAPAPVPTPAPPAQPGMAPELAPAAPVHDYFAAETPAAPAPEPAPAEEAAPVEQAVPAAEPASAIEATTIPLLAPALAPAEESAPVALPTVAPPAPAPEPAPEPELAPAAVVAPQPEPVELRMMAPTPEPVELPAIAPEPELPAVQEPEPVEAALPAIEPVALVETAPAPEPAPELEELFATTSQRTGFSVVVRLKDGDGVEVGSFRDFGTAMEGAQEVIEQFSTAAEGQWPFYAGRFIRPDLIVSVDVVEGETFGS